MSYDKRFKVTLHEKKQPCEGRSLPSSSAWLSSCRAATNMHFCMPGTINVGQGIQQHACGHSHFFLLDILIVVASSVLRV